MPTLSLFQTHYFSSPLCFDLHPSSLELWLLHRSSVVSVLVSSKGLGVHGSFLTRNSSPWVSVFHVGQTGVFTAADGNPTNKFFFTQGLCCMSFGHFKKLQPELNGIKRHNFEKSSHGWQTCSFILITFSLSLNHEQLYSQVVPGSLVSLLIHLSKS